MDYEYDDLITDELFDQCEQVRSIAKKSWLSSATVSLAHLDNVKAKVYNVGLVDPRDLKATNLRSKTKVPELPTEPPLSVVKERNLTAWGSNNSIPDIFPQQQGEAIQKPSRPASAKHSKWTRPPSGKKTRPQSAKEPIQIPYSVSEAETDKRQGFGVKGAKYDPNGRPPKGISYTSSVGWVGPPAGLKYPDKPSNGTDWKIEFPMDGEEEEFKKEEELSEKEADLEHVPRPPHTTPVPPEVEEKPKRIFELYIGDPYREEEDFIQSDSEEEEFGPSYTASRLSSASPNNSTQGLGEIQKDLLRLDLPTVDDDYDEIDEIDTERLLAEAESVSQNLDLKGIINANKHIPQSTASHVTKSTNQKVSKTELDSNSKAKAKNLVSEMIDEHGLEFTKPETEKSKKDNITRPTSSVKFNENVRTVSITPRNIGRKVEEMHHGKKKLTPNSVDAFIDLIEVKNRIEPVLSTTKAELSSPPSSSHNVSRSNYGSRPPSGKVRPSTKSSTSVKPYVNENNRLYGATSMNSNNAAGRPRSAPLNRAPRPITTVTVDYGEVEKGNQDDAEKEQKRRKRKTDDVVTAMESLTRTERKVSSDKQIKSNSDKGSRSDKKGAVEDLNEDKDDILNTVVKSEPVKNYYEISRHSSMSNHGCVDDTSGQIGANKNVPVIKTTKTLEFDELKPKEVTVKSVIDPQTLSTKEKEQFVSSLQLKDEGRPKSRLRPSSAKPPVSKPSSGENERPGSRLGFVSMTPSKTASDKSEQKTKKLSRPSSAPVQRSNKPPAREKKADVKGDKENISQDEAETVNGDVKDEREKVIDNLLERTKTLLVDCDKKLEQEESKSDILKTKSLRRPTSAHVGLTSRTKDTRRVQSATTKRPVSASTVRHKHYASYSQGSSSVLKPRKSSAKSRTKVVLTEPCIITTNTAYFEEETEEDLACQDLQKDLADKGLNITAETLQRALYPPSGKSKYYQITADLPKRSSLSLLSHPKVWLPQEYKRLQSAEKTLSRANEIMYLQKKAEERRAKLEAMGPEARKKLKKKGKKGGKKLRKSQNLG